MILIKKDGSEERFNKDKMKKAFSISAERAMVNLTDEEKDMIADFAEKLLLSKNLEKVSVKEAHNAVETALEKFNHDIAESYRSYRNYKTDFVAMLDEIYEKDRNIRHIGDKENSNTDSALVATKRSLTYGEYNRKIYMKYFMNALERAAIKAGFIYVHDTNARRDCINCCLFNMGEVLKDKFEMGNIVYTEATLLDVVFNVMSDVVLSTAAQQYGGFTIPEIDKILGYYAEKSFRFHKEEFYKIHNVLNQNKLISETDSVVLEDLADQYAMKRVERDFMQGWQGFEMRLNTVGSSRGDYPFVTVTGGLGTERFEKMAMITLFRVHSGGQGEKGKKVPVLFPKIVMLYDKEITEEGKINEDVFEAAIQCSSKTMYPDWLSLTGNGYVASMYKQYKRPISPMGCRAFLSPWYEKGGMHPADENDKPVFVGRFNIGAISLNLPMILAKSREEGKDFFQVLDYYLEMIRQLHIRTYDYLAKNIKASTNPVAFCEGGFYNPDTNGPSHLRPNESIKPLLKCATASFGITALNELQQLYNGQSLVQACEEYFRTGDEEGYFALKVMKHINERVSEYKEIDGNMYAIYGTPAESLCGKQVEQFRAKYGVIPGVSDREYVSNSFHCHVTEDITPIQKQDYEEVFWDLCNGGKIQYVKYPIGYNIKSIKTLIRRAMDKGFYEGVNLSMSFCPNCGHQELNMKTCTHCGSKDLIIIERMNGYLSFYRVHGDTRLNSAKVAEIVERKSM